jgi:ADP-ribose pyrophosphatase YjhB (NUDIX family)
MTMDEEISAGGIVFRKKNTGWEVLTIRDSKEYLTFPKGRIEPGETIEGAAIREIAEETGIEQITILSSLPIVQYTFKRNSTTIAKTVHYFVCLTSDMHDPRPQASEGLKEAVFKDITAAGDQLGYQMSHRPIYNEAVARIKNIAM